MKQNLAIISLLASLPAYAVELTPECKMDLESKTRATEMARLESQDEKLASELTARSYVNFWPAGGLATVVVELTDPKDGRSVQYRAKVTPRNAEACKVTLARANQTACRYSASEGPSSLNKIRGLKFKKARRVIKPDTAITPLEEQQITVFLDSDAPALKGAPVKELIEQTDDNELLTGTLSLPGGRKLSYLGAYAGDNAIGIFFEEGTTKMAGKNGDDSICIK